VKNAGWRVNLRWSIQPYAGVFVKSARVARTNRPRPRDLRATRDGAQPLRRSLWSCASFSSDSAKSDPRAPRAGLRRREWPSAPSGLDALHEPRIARTRSLPVMVACLPGGDRERKRIHPSLDDAQARALNPYLLETCGAFPGGGLQNFLP
jgi:hypothetical protein